MVSLVALAISLTPLIAISLILWLSSAEERWLERGEEISERLEEEYRRNATLGQESVRLARKRVPPGEDRRAA